jgi:hypothetical protein
VWARRRTSFSAAVGLGSPNTRRPHERRTPYAYDPARSSRQRQSEPAQRRASAARRRSRTTSSSRRSPISTASASRSGSCTHAALAPTATSRLTARSAMSRPQSTPGPRC